MVVIMKFKLGFGTGFKDIEIPDKNVINVLGANDIEIEYRGNDAVLHALDNPIASARLSEKVKAGQKVVILTSDISRPMPTYEVLPPILDELYSAGVKPSDITLVFACGSHRHHSETEMRKLAGDRAWNEIRCVDSDPDDCINFGYTKYGTPVDITRVVAQADFRICLGNIEYHYFAGYSGGAKALMPGCSTPAAISYNHAMMVDPRCHAGNIDDNPLRADLEEAASLCGIDYIVNVVLDEDKKIVYACAGDYIEAHREGCRFLDRMYKIRIDRKADIVIAANSGAPKDATLYQTQKALDNAKHAVRDGGTVILVGACNEGLGSKVFEEWMYEARKPEDLVERLKKEFKLGGHKACAIALIMRYADIKLVSELDDECVRACFMEPYECLEAAFYDAMEHYGEDASVIVMPYGGVTLPICDSGVADVFE